MRLSLPFAFVAASLLSAASPATAARVAANPPATANALLIKPLTFFKLDDMDFAMLAAPAAGTAVIDPNSNTMTTTGGVVAVSGTPHAAQFQGATVSSSVVNIKVPVGSVTLTRQGGTETMTVSNFTVEGTSKRVLAARQVFTFRVGGTLNVAANQVEGLYSGTFDVTVQYP
ncbi:DUF4402 domain-containing protein [Sphingomonas ginkgonis]|uniref:DUF4402 domain-containing protein n=1 Tax=Sphingomonas ginkgonis TaxID=2315330 RepID=A0A3R9YKU5_9SPHN|nr:DUF4402 domain-containing protein [Sphingomonas ginkgonis]RST29808.1 DUF4402 domain-containing protein [Sphingomonas ginkgonis]